MASVTLKNVWKIYNAGQGANEVEAVKNVSLECHNGEFLALLGPSGCGKTSTLRMIAGLEDITRGEISIGDRVVNRLHPSQRDIAMVFESYALYEHLTVYENIAFPLKVRGLAKDEIEQRVKEAVEILDIGDLLKRVPAHLSDGQKQRVSIGRAIVRKPAAFLMDEPISHLDALLRSRMRREVTHLQKELGVTTLYVTHDQLEATAMADRIAVMSQGDLQQLGTPREIFEKPANVFVADFVGEPPMNFVKAELAGSSGGVELRREGFALTVSEPTRAGALRKLDGQAGVTIGIRPMHIQAHLAETAGAVPAQVYVTEPLDEFNIVTTIIHGERVLVETAPDVLPEIDQTVWLTFPDDKLHLFHPLTGQSLLS